MSLVVGMNLDPALYPEPLPSPFATTAVCGDAGFRSARITCDLRRTVQHHRDFEAALRVSECTPFRVLCRESFTPDEWGVGQWSDRIRWWRNQLGEDAWWEAGNEPEDVGGESSAVMGPLRFGALLEDTRAALGSDAFIISGGLVSGNPDWLRKKEVWPHLKACNGIGHDLYEMSPSPTEAAITPFPDRILSGWINAALDVSADAGLPIYIPEIGYGISFMKTDEARARAYLLALAMLAPHVAGIWPFSYEGVPNYALRPGGNPALAWNVCSGFAMAQSPQQPQPTKEAAMADMSIEQLVACTTEADGTPRKTGLYAPIKTVAPGVRVAFSNVEDEVVWEIDGIAQAFAGKPNPH